MPEQPNLTKADQMAAYYKETLKMLKESEDQMNFDQPVNVKFMDDVISRFKTVITYLSIGSIKGVGIRERIKTENLVRHMEQDLATYFDKVKIGDNEYYQRKEMDVVVSEK